MKKKILFVINTMGRAGAEKCLISMLGYMDREKYDISLFSVINRGELFSLVPKGVKVLNENPCTKSVFEKATKRELARFILKNGFKKGYFFKEASYLRTMVAYQRTHKGLDFKKLFWKLLSDHAERQEETYDLAVAYIQGAATYYVMDHVKAKKKIVFLHTEFLDSGYCPELEKRYYEKADAIYCVSKSICSHLAQVFPQAAGKMNVFYNMLNREEIEEKALIVDEKTRFVLKDMEKKKKEGETLLITAARLEAIKAYDLAVSALALVRKQGYQVSWYVLGEGPERDSIQKLVKEYGLEESFLLLGAADNPYPYMRACDIYVQATLYEGCCTSISEAVILNKPVIASDCDGNKEQLNRYETGILVKLTVEGIARGIIQAVSEEGLCKELVKKANLSELDPDKALSEIYSFLEE